jgi:hypothetical protein
MKHIFFIFILAIGISCQYSYSQQATLTLVNKSDREMTTKVLKGTDRKAELYQQVVVPPKGKKIVYFNATGRYFTKTMAILYAKDTLTQNDTIYNKSQYFEVIADRRGYSNLTMKFKVKKSKKPVVSGVIAISRKEYEVD